jgi:hypothetical protein
VGWIKMHRDRTLGGGPKTEVTSSRRKQSALLRETNEDSLCGHPADLWHGPRPPGEARARKE